MAVAPNYAIPDTLLVHRNLSAGTTGSVVKTAGGKIYRGHISNSNAAPRYLKLYDKATAPTNADTPIETIYLPPASTVPFYTDHGIPFATGISYRCSTGVADNDNTAPSANDVIVNLNYL